MAVFDTQHGSDSTMSSCVFLPWLEIEEYYQRIKSYPKLDFCAYSPFRGKYKDKVCGSRATNKNRSNTMNTYDYTCAQCDGKTGILPSYLAVRKSRLEKAALSNREKSPISEKKTPCPAESLSEQESPISNRKNSPCRSVPPEFAKWIKITQYSSRVKDYPDTKFCDYSPTHGGHKNLVCAAVTTEGECKYYPGLFRCINCKYKHRGISLETLKQRFEIERKPLSPVSDKNIVTLWQASTEQKEKYNSEEDSENSEEDSEEEVPFRFESPFQQPLVTPDIKEWSIDISVGEEKKIPKNFILEEEAKMARYENRLEKRNKPKRARGRPRKNSSKEVDANKPKRGRGRPAGSKNKSLRAKRKQALIPVRSLWITATELLQKRLANPRDMRCAYSPESGRYCNKFCGNEIQSTDQDNFWQYRCAKCERTTLHNNGVNVLISIMYPYFLEGVVKIPLTKAFDEEPLSLDEDSEEEKKEIEDMDELEVKENESLTELLGAKYFLWPQGINAYLVRIETNGNEDIMIVHGRFETFVTEDDVITIEDLKKLEDPAISLKSNKLIKDIFLDSPFYVLDLLKTK